MKKILIITAMAVLCLEANAKLSLRQPTGDHMVLQQQTEASVWGYASAGSQVTVIPSWDGKKYQTRTDANGQWSVSVSTPAASYNAYTISVSGDGGAVTVNDVLVGEVWLASGQSNMEIPLRGFSNCPIENYNEVITQAPSRDKIRMMYAHADASEEPLVEVRITEGWQGADPNTIPEMSAVAYFFARKLNQVLDIPIGIVAFPRGGARVESWLPKEKLASYGTEDLSKEGMEKRVPWERPYLMYNAMEIPLQGYTGRGFIWYQGCSNVGQDEDVFVSRMSDMVNIWRNDWGDTKCGMPFYMVEIAPYLYSRDNGEAGARLRRAQHRAAKEIPNAGIVCTNDLVSPYEADNIHPCRKEPIGNRLAYMALKRNYGFARVICDSPEAVEIFKRQPREGDNRPVPANEICVKVLNCPNGIARTHEIEGLEVCGKDGDWKEVTDVSFGWDTLTISHPEVAEPCAVRYGWADFKPGNLANNEGLPMVPFILYLK